MYYFDDRVRYSECDENGDLSLVAMMNYLQDCSTFHSESLDVGLDRHPQLEDAFAIVDGDADAVDEF